MNMIGNPGGPQMQATPSNIAFGNMAVQRPQQNQMAMQAMRPPQQSEADAGSMRGYDPNLGLGKSGMSQMMYQGARPTPMQGQINALQRMQAPQGSYMQGAQTPMGQPTPQQFGTMKQDPMSFIKSRTNKTGPQ